MIDLGEEIRVEEVLISLNSTVVVAADDLFRVAVERMSKVGIGLACVVDGNGCLLGVLTDGDIRRILLRHHKSLSALFSEDVSTYMTRTPKAVRPDDLLSEALLTMEKVEISDLPVVDGSNRLIGFLHLHTVLKKLFGL